MKEKHLWIGLLIVVVSWAGNCLFWQSKQIDQPIFLDHYYETYLQDDNYLTFHYLTNKHDQSKVSYAVVDGVDVELYPASDGFSMRTSNVPKFEQEFSHQHLKSVRLKLPTPFLPIEQDSEDVWSFEEISFIFSNGEEVNADIGKVNVYGTLPGSDIFETRVSSSSNHHRSDKTLVAAKPVTIESITVPFAEQIDHDVDVKVMLDQEKLKELEALKDGANPPIWFEEERNLEWSEIKGVSIKEEIFPITLDQNDWIQLSMQFNPDRKSFFEFGVSISGTTDGGDPFLRKAPIIDHPYLTDQIVSGIITEKQGGT